MITIPATVVAHFAAVDTRLAAILPDVNWDDWLGERAEGDYYFSLTRNIIYQQLAGRAADTIFSRFRSLVPNFTPQAVLAVPDQTLRDAGLSWSKVKYVKDLASKVASGELNLLSLPDREDEEVIAELTKVKGIGRWTAEMFLLFTLKRPDIFSHLDLGLKNGFAKLYKIESPTREQIEAVVSKWVPYKSYGSIALWHHLDNR